MKYAIFVALWAIVLGSCGKDTTPSISTNQPTSFLSLVADSIDADANISIIANDYFFATQHPVSIDLKGYFKDAGTLVSINDLKIAGLTLPELSPAGSNQYGLYLNRASNLQQNFNQVSSAFGTNCSVVLQGSNFPSFTSTAKIPTQILIPHKVVLSKNSGTTVTWNPDLSGDKVAIFIEYQPKPSNQEDPSMPDSPMAVWKIVQDNGSATFSAIDLSTLPLNGLANVYIGRVASTTIDVNGKRVLVNAVSYQVDAEVRIGN